MSNNENERRSPFDKVNTDGLTTEERKQLSDPNFKYTTGKMEAKKEKTFGSKPKSKDTKNKMYIVFIVSEIGEHPCSYLGQNDLNVDGEFGICNGREDAYDYIKAILEMDDEEAVDILASTVLVEGVSCTERVTWYRFMKYCEEFYPNDDFDIDDYVINDYEEDTMNPIVSATGNGVSMASMMLNEIKNKNEEE